MNFDNRLGRGKLTGEVLVLLAQAGEFGGRGRGARTASSLRSKGGEGSLGTQTAPFAQMRRIQTLATQESTELTGSQTRIGFCEDAQFVGGGELAAVGACDDFGIGRR